MSNRRKPRDVLSQLPDWDDAGITELDGGLTNRSWLVEAGDRRAVLKVDDEVRAAPYNSRAAEAQIQARAAGRAGQPTPGKAISSPDAGWRRVSCTTTTGYC